MASERTERKLAAILAADVVGYSRLMGIDEEATLASLNEHRRALIDPAIARHRGHIVKTTGDGFLAAFASVVDAVRCAAEVQVGMAERNAATDPDRRLEFRIGINVGDVVEQAGDIFGDGVNIAARLEGIAEPGGICVSARVAEDARGKIDIAFEDMGEQNLKNIERPIRTFRLGSGAGAGGSATSRPAPGLPDKPSIAVLPFQNMSGDAEQDYFADGMVEDIITALSRARWLFVIARNSSFVYKGRAVDVKQVGRELGVRYVLEGSVRKAGSRVRITGQLIDAASGAHLWADHFDGELADIFELQDQVTARVVGAIAPKLEEAEIERAKRKPTESLDAYDCFLRGMAAFHDFTRAGNETALGYFARAIEIDPEFAAAHGMAARCYVQRKGFGWVGDRPKEVEETRRLALRAAEKGREDAVALTNAGFALTMLGALEDGAAFLERAISLNPNLAGAWFLSGLASALLGEPEAAIERAERALRLSPQDPQMFGTHAIIALGHFIAGRYDEASTWAATARRERPNFLMANCLAAASAALGGRPDVAQEAMAHAREIDPTLRISNLQNWLVFKHEKDFARWREGLRKAGLPD